MNKNRGFTIVELLIATTILTFVLAGASFVVVQIGRLYYKGVVMSRTQDAARNIVEAISRPIQLENGTAREGNSIQLGQGITDNNSNGVFVNAWCIGDQRYSYITDMQVSDTVSGNPGVDNNAHTRRALYRDNNATSDCTAIDITQEPLSTVGDNLLPQGMRLNKLDIQSVDPQKQIWKITVDVSYGDTDLMEGSDTQNVDGVCRTNVAGGQFCAQAQYSTTVVKRVRN